MKELWKLLIVFNLVLIAVFITLNAPFAFTLIHSFGLLHAFWNLMEELFPTPIP